jgi:Fe(3+) dicitrate transport protein
VLNLGVGVARASGFSVRLQGDVVSSQFGDDLNTLAPTAQGRRGRLPGYTVLNASTRIPLPPLGRRAALTGSIRNIANRVYITDRQEGIMTGMPRLVTAGFDVVY